MGRVRVHSRAFVHASPLAAGSHDLPGPARGGRGLLRDLHLVNFGEGFGPGDRFDPSSNPFPPPSGSLNGVSGGIVNENFCATCSTFANGANKGPLVQNQMVLTWEVDTTFDVNQIGNVQPLYGTDGAPLIPEPTSVLLFAVGLFVTGRAVSRARRR